MLSHRALRIAPLLHLLQATQKTKLYTLR
nr:TPA_asm: m16 uORF [Murid betaherpesvirus 1]DBA07724.1 TPA_asm: m16 uORF [Murid betaherpesvirus 1]